MFTSELSKSWVPPLFPLDMLGAAGVACFSCGALLPLWRHIGSRLTRFVERLYRIFMAWPLAQGWMRR